MIERSIPRLVGIQIIPSETIPAGFKRMVGETIFVNPWNYQVLRSLSHMGTLLALGLLDDLISENDPQMGTHA